MGREMTNGERQLKLLTQGRAALHTGDDEARRQAIDELRATGLSEQALQLLRPEEVGR